MDNVTLFCLAGLFVLFVLFVLPRLTNSENQRGTGRPRYDDPDIEGRGSFGQPRNPDGGNMNFPWRSGTGRNTSNNPTRRDDPDVSGRGSFGRDKD